MGKIDANDKKNKRDEDKKKDPWNRGKKEKELDNKNQVTVERKYDRDHVDIFHGSGESHSHTVIEDDKVVFDRDEHGTKFLDTKRGDPPADTK